MGGSVPWHCPAAGSQDAWLVGGYGREKEADPSPAPDTLLVATRRLHGGLVQSEDGRSCPGGGRGLDKRTRAWTAVRGTEAGCTEELEAARRVRHWEACLGEVYGKFLLQVHTLASFPAGHLPGSWTPQCTPAGWGWPVSSLEPSPTLLHPPLQLPPGMLIRGPAAPRDRPVPQGNGAGWLPSVTAPSFRYASCRPGLVDGDGQPAPS